MPVILAELWSLSTWLPRFWQLMSDDKIPFPQTLVCATVCRMNLEWWCQHANAIS